MARSSLCFVLALVALTTLWAPIRAEAAGPPTPVLTGTEPASPNTSLTPTVHGSSTGVIISSFPGLRTSAITSAGIWFGRTILLYPNKSCEGTPFAEGTDEELDTTGIQVAVAAETTTYISAQQEDSESVSTCSNAIEYKQVKELPKEEPPAENPGGGTTAPPDPPHLRTAPGGWANDTTPVVTGSAPGADSVKIFDVANCTGNPVAKVPVAQLSAGVSFSVVPNAITAFSGISVGAGGESRCSQPVFYGEDSTAPQTRITMGPASKTRRRVAIFRFTDTTGTAPGTKFFCRVNRRKWKACRSPMRLNHLRRHRYLFRVKAVDPAGNTDAKPAKRRFKVVAPG